MSRTNRNLFLFFLMSVLLVACGTSGPVEEPAVEETAVKEAEEPAAEVAETPKAEEPTEEAEAPAAEEPAEEAEEPAAEQTVEEPAEAVEPARGGAVVRAMTSEPAQIDPQGTPTSGLALVLPYLFDTLVVRDIDNSVHPLLAESWQVSEDGLEITFQLKEGVTFHDGSPLNAAAVQFTYERFKELGTRSPIYGGVMQIAAIEAVDDLTVRFSFEAPAANIWSTLSMPYAGIISPESARQVDESGEGHVVGSGPFLLESWDAGQSIILASNPNYAWGSPITENQNQPYLDALIYKVIPDPATQLAAFQSGEVNVFWINQPSHRLVLEADDTVEMVDAHTNGLVYLGFNCQKAPFDQVLVRQALSHAVNKVEILELAVGGIGELATAPLPSTLPGYDPSLDEHEFGFDPQKAQELLLEAGLVETADGGWEWEGEALSLQLLTSTRAPNGDIATLVQSQFQAIGVPVEIQQLDSRAVAQATTEGAFDLLVYRYGWNDPDALSIFLSSARIGRTNRVAYGNPDVDALLEQGAHELDEAARIAIYVDAQEIIMQDAPWQPLYYTMDVIAINEQVQGARVGHMGRLLLNDAYIVAD